MMKDQKKVNQKKLKEKIEKEIRRLRKELDSVTDQGKKLDSGLKTLQKAVAEIPWFKFDSDENNSD